jgi:MFS transporter, putative metabolite:H+ symporter
MLNKITGGDKNAAILIIVAALGYFVDIYDLVLFGIVREPSLRDLGLINPDDLKQIGARLLNWQMGGMLVGGIIWGILGDKKGRLNVLFGSIIMYSVANLLNAGVDKITFMDQILAYEILRFIAGVGLAGELGAGITLVSETMPKETRGIGTMLVAGVGISGAIAANLVNKFTDSWQLVYLIGGILGILLLIMRIGVYESKMFKQVSDVAVSKGSIKMLFSPFSRFVKYLSVIAIAVPVWYVVGILMIFSPELAREAGMKTIPVAGDAIMYCYIGITLGDFGSGLLSQIIRSRKKAMLYFMIATVLLTVLYFLFAFTSIFVFNLIAVSIGFATGYWAVFITTAAESFGTNIRATVATTAPNFVRGAVVLITNGFLFFSLSFGNFYGAVIVGIITFAVGFLALAALKETFGKDLDYLEE